MMPRGKIARDAALRSAVHRHIAQHHTIDMIAAALQTQAVSRAAIGRYVQDYHRAYHRLTALSARPRASLPDILGDPEREHYGQLQLMYGRLHDILAVLQGRDISATEAMLRAEALPIPDPETRDAGVSDEAIDLIRRRILGLSEHRPTNTGSE
jgi:hypothetical protein